MVLQRSTPNVPPLLPPQQIAVPITYGFPVFVWIMSLFWRNFAMPMHIPTTLARALTFKFFRDLSRIPSLGELMGAVIRLLLSGDASQWDRALLMPHYNATAMPALSVHQGRVQ